MTGPQAVEGIRAFALANTVTGFATLGAGLMCLLLTWLMHPQPARWHAAYWTIVVTGVFTITLHGYGEAVPRGSRHVWSMLDTGSNLVVAWALTLAFLGDYYTRAFRLRLGAVATAVMLLGWWFLWRDRPETRQYLIPFGAHGGFYGGEAMLILLSWVNVGVMFARWRLIPRVARPLLLLTFAIFFGGMLLATASNSRITPPFFALHALWHIVGAFGFIAFWAFNHQRFVAHAAAGDTFPLLPASQEVSASAGAATGA